MGTSPGEKQPRDTSANETPDPVPSKAAGNRLPPLPRSLRPLPVARPVATPPVSPLPLGPTQTTAIAGPPPPAIAASPARKANADVTLIVTPLPPPIIGPGAARGRSPSPRVIVEPVAAPPAAEAPAAEAPAPAVPATEVPAPEARAAEARPVSSGAGNAAPARRLRIRTAAIAGAVLVAAILVIAIGFSREDLPRARAATELDRLSPPDPGASPDPVPGPAADPPKPPGAAVEPAQPAVADRPQRIAPSEAPPSTATPPPAPRPRPRSSAPSSQISATRDAGPARPAGRSRARAVRPLTYDPNTLFLDKR